MPDNHTLMPSAKQPAIAPVRAYWDDLRQGRAAPSRADIDPTAISPYLGQSGIVERTANGRVKLRLAGKQVQNLMQMDPRGTPLRTLFTLNSRDRLNDLLDDVFFGPSLLTMTLTTEPLAGDPITAQMALMPLTDMGGAVSRALMVLTVPPGPIPAPCRFHIRHAHVTPTTQTHLPPVPLAERPRLRLIQGGLS